MVLGSKFAGTKKIFRLCTADYSDGLFYYASRPDLRQLAGLYGQVCWCWARSPSALLHVSVSLKPTPWVQLPGYITEQQVGIVTKMVEAEGRGGIIGRLDKPRTTALPAPGANGPLPAPAVAPRPMASTGHGLPPLPSPSVTQPLPATPMPFPDGTVATASPSSSSAQPVQRRRRTKAEMEAARAQAPAAPPQPQQAPFRQDPAPAAFRPDPAPIAASPVRHRADPPAPPPGLDLDAVFKWICLPSCRSRSACRLSS